MCQLFYQECIEVLFQNLVLLLLRVETSRYEHLPLEERTCPMCRSILIEDEYNDFDQMTEKNIIYVLFNNSRLSVFKRRKWFVYG